MCFVSPAVRNCRERWRTIRSSFLRSLKLARTQTGRGKRKYYLSKYLQFLVPFTKSRSCHKQLPGMVLRKPGQAATAQQEDEVVAAEEEAKVSDGEMPLDVQVSEEEHRRNQEQDREQPTACLPLRLHSIKVEHDSSNANQQLERMVSQQSLVSVPAAALGNHLGWSDLTQWFKGHGSGHHKLTTTTTTPTPPPPPPQPATSALRFHWRTRRRWLTTGCRLLLSDQPASVHQGDERQAESKVSTEGRRTHRRYSG